MLHLHCHACGTDFTQEDGVHEAYLAWNFGRCAGDYVCPYCSADDSQIEEIYKTANCQTSP